MKRQRADKAYDHRKSTKTELQRMSFKVLESQLRFLFSTVMCFILFHLETVVNYSSGNLSTHIWRFFFSNLFCLCTPFLRINHFPKKEITKKK